MKTSSEFYTLRDNLRALRDTLPALRGELLGYDSADSVPPPPWREKLVRNVLPAIDFDLPVLLVAICGGGSTGKSTLFNMLAGQTLSRVGFRAGLTARVLLAGHPSVLSGPGVAEALLHRLQETPVRWQADMDTTQPGPPLYASSPEIPPNLLLIDTPDFDTGETGRLLNRERAEPVLRTAEVVLYLFTNTVYNNLSNARFMADVVGGIGGRPTILVYRISRAAPDDEVLEHCRTVARKLYGMEGDGPFPRQVVGIYRTPESDAVAEGQATPRLIPLSPITGGRSLHQLLADLDVAEIKRHVFDADLRSIHAGATIELEELRGQAEQAQLYRQALQSAMAQQALEALQAFPVNEAVTLATRLFLETSPGYVKVLRGTGRVFAAPLRGLQALSHKLAAWSGMEEGEQRARGVEDTLSQDLVVAANTLRNRLMDDALIVRVAQGDELLQATRARARQPVADLPQPIVEPLGQRAYNLHIPVPQVVLHAQNALMAHDWEQTARTLRETARRLIGLPSDIEAELRTSVAEFRQGMTWQQRVRETFFASLSALPPLLGVTYTLLTVNPVAGAGVWIPLESIFGLNDLWALVSIPASVGLSEQERKQLEQMITPVFKLWLQRRVTAIVQTFQATVCQPILAALDRLPAPDDPRFAEVTAALATMGDKL
ncbi:MAG: GTPase domain-containing protein [Chloroflexi bacterium]|jgi:hypothetical protein|nr:GTPase domain-containing protein [Chloroflexota bacterium]